MGAPKQKWTNEEEGALKAGVEKYGPGKWRAIQKDSELGPCLIQRSNVDLKDKWRNMSVASSNPLAIVLKEKPHSRPPRMAISSVEQNEEGTAGRRSAAQLAMYDNLIVEAIAQLQEPGGSSTQTISKHIEENNSVPSNFKRSLSSRLKALVESGTLVKVKQNYRLAEEAPLALAFRLGKRTRVDLENPLYSIARDSAKPLGGAKADLPATKRVKIDSEVLKQKKRNAEEAARFAALAVAEAEALAAEAERAACEAEEAEEEAEERGGGAGEGGAETEAAASSFRPPKKRGQLGGTARHK